VAPGRGCPRGAGFRVPEEDEVTGIDSVVHAETGYDLDSIGGGGSRSTSIIGQAHAEARNTEGVRA
jgi:Amt family ammonium transporter